MHYKCNNCGGSMVYSPAEDVLYCPHCEGRNCGVLVSQKDMDVCPVCGAPVEAGDFGSAMQCGNCGTYLILENRVEDGYRPQKIIPFKITKEQAVESIRKEFGGRPFIPRPFTDHKALMGIEGVYVPYWLHDYNSVERFTGTGQRVRMWTHGDMQFRETSYFEVIREIGVDFDNVPADASDRMDDDLMDMIEPYNYDQMTDFSPEFMAGFNGEIYNRPSQEYVIRSRTKADKAIRKITDDTIHGYAVVTPTSQNIDARKVKEQYVLLPVYKYTYRFGGKNYDIFVNGQTGKIAGEAPTSVGLAAKYTIATFGLGFLFLMFAGSIAAML